MKVQPIDPTDRLALEHLAESGPDAPGVVDCEAVLCAHLVYLDLEKRGLVSREQAEDGPVYAITAAGRQALAPTLH